MGKLHIIYLAVFLLFISCKQKEKTVVDATVSMPADNTLTELEKQEGWHLLFDGQTLSGWRMYQNKEADAWGVKDGEIYCKGDSTDKSDLHADLVTAEMYENYELSIDWKIAPQGNSGIMYHVVEDFPAAYLSGPEYQLIDDDNFPGELEDWQKTGADYAMYTTTSRPTNPIGEFNTTKIVVNGAHREHWLNGVKVVEFEAWTPDWLRRKSEGKWKDDDGYGMAKKGHICLQDHGGGVWFKNIKIKVL